MVKLKELGVIITGNTPKKSNPKNYISNDICFIKPSDISKCSKFNIIQSEYYISEYARKSARIVPPNCVLVTCIGIIGNVAINDVECAFNQQINAIIPDENKCLAEYLAFAIQSQKEKLQNIANAPVVPIINKKQFSNFQIPLYDLDRQRKIVNNLKNICIIIEQKKMQLSKLDELVKARFVEMFGDLKENSNNYNVVPFEKVIEYIGDIGSNGANKVVVEHLNMKNEEDYALMVRFLNFTKNDFEDDVKFISKESYEFFSKSKIFGGELIICKIGSAGQNYVMPYLNRPVSLGLNQILVRVNNKIIMTYLYQYLHTDYGEFLISNCINGAVTKTITKTKLKKIPIILPPIQLQNEFGEFAEQVEKSKKDIQQSLEKLETLKKSLMQEYFG